MTDNKPQMLICLIFSIFFLKGIALNPCEKLDCMFTTHNNSFWVTSIAESCPINKPTKDLATPFPCYRFGNSSYLNGTAIANNCGLYYDCLLIIKPKQEPPISTLIIFASVAIILLSLI